MDIITYASSKNYTNKAKPGLISENNIEIFNDYENNDTNISYGFITGRNNKAIVRGFEITAVDTTNCTFTLDSVQGISIGNNIHYFFIQDDGTIKKIIDKVKTIDGNNVTFSRGKINAVIDKVNPNAEGNIYSNGKWIIVDVSNGIDGNIGTTELIVDEDQSVHMTGTNNIGGLLVTVTGHDNEVVGYMAQGSGWLHNVTGERGHAFGYSHIVSGDEAFAEGAHNTASGYAAHAEGQNTFATEYGAHAEGHNARANGWASHAEGRDTTASSEKAHAEGWSTKAIAAASHAEGYATHAEGMFSHAEGQKTKTTGDQAHAEGYNTRAAHNSAHAEGSDTLASGASAHAEGYYTEARGHRTHAEGWKTVAQGENSHAEGYDTISLGNYAHAEGYSTAANGEGAHAEGYSTAAVAAYTHAEGYNTEARAIHSHAEGELSNAFGEISHAEGYSSTASGTYTHAEGLRTLAEGNASHAEGNSTKAIGTMSHAEGYLTEASGYISHAEGYNTIAQGDYSHAQNYNTIAAGHSQTVIGKYNILDYDEKYAFIIGNGNGNDIADRSNACTIDWNGNAYFSGGVITSYSRTPKQIGIWIDGTPIYRIAFSRDISTGTVNESIIIASSINGNTNVPCLILAAECFSTSGGPDNTTYRKSDMNFINNGTTYCTEIQFNNDDSTQTKLYGWIDFVSAKLSNNYETNSN